MLVFFCNQRNIHTSINFVSGAKIMPHHCKGVECIKRKTSKRYKQGAVRCTRCEVFMEFEGVFCPCCGSKVARRSPHGNRNNVIQQRKMELRCKTLV